MIKTSSRIMKLKKNRELYVNTLSMCCFLVFSLLSLFGNAQISINGSIKSESNEPLIYANVYLKNYNVLAISNENGNFELKIKKNRVSNDTLIISYIGYETKVIPLFVNQTKMDLGVIILQLESEQLPTLTISSPPHPKQIIKRAIKKIKKNYSRETEYYGAFYRELMEENDLAIELNEAIVNIEYSGYPSNKFVKKSFREFYKNQTTFKSFKSFGNVFMYAQYFPYFISEDDKVFIQYARKSYNFSLFANEPAPYGGPNDLLAFDKVKYLYDFLDPKMLSDYTFKYLGKDIIDGIICYKIEFEPKKSEIEKVFHNYSKEMEFPIYRGIIYINIDDYAILSFKGQNYIEADFSIYNKRGSFKFPDSEIFYVNYKKNSKGKYYLYKVKSEQTIIKKINYENVKYKSIRSIYLSQKENLKELNDDAEIYYYGVFNSLRNFVGHYDSEYWDYFETQKDFKKLGKEAITNLEASISLKDQYQTQNINIKEVPIPITTNDSLLFSDEGTKLNFEELKSHYDTLLYKTIKSENDYYETVLEKLKKYKRSFIHDYFNVYRTDETSDNYMVIDGKKVTQTADSLNQVYLSLYPTQEKVFNLSSISKNKINFNIEEIKFNHKSNVAITYSEKGNLSYTLVINNYFDDTILVQLNNVKEFYWLNDSLIIYSKANLQERVFQLKTININTPDKGKVIFEEANTSTEIELSISSSKLYYFLQVKNGDKIKYIVYDNKADLAFNTFRNYNKSVYSLDHFNGNILYSISINESGLNSIEKHQFINDSAKIDTLYITENYIDDFKITNDFIVFTEYSKGSYRIKYIEKKTKQIEECKFIPEYSSVTIEESNLIGNEIAISFQSKIEPYIKVGINLENQLYDTLDIEKVNDDFRSELYTYEYLEFNLNDSISIPISLIYNKMYKDSLKGIIIKGYGAYGSINFPSLNVEDLVYANNGIAVAMIFSRGSSERGLDWYKQGKLLNKKNTFTDYIACSKFLKNRFKLKTNQLIGYGSSAGGLIMGVVANNEPDLFGALIMNKPFLNVTDPMLNTNLPLTTLEYNEWGNVSDSTYFEYVNSYSPFQNISGKDLPNMMILAKQNDMQVPYWYIAKTAIKYREFTNNGSLILFNTDFQAGHRGNKNYLIEVDFLADQFAFIMNEIKIPKK